MVCFRSWVKNYGAPSEHIIKLPKEIEDLEPDKRIDPDSPYTKKSIEDEEKPKVVVKKDEEKKDADGEKTDGEDEAPEKEVTPEMLKCYEYHKRECPYYEEHPLIKEKDFYEFKDEYVGIIIDKTKENAEKKYKTGDPDIVKVADKLKQTADPRKDPRFEERVKMCTVRTETEEL